jgi:hypothetical protein
MLPPVNYISVVYSSNRLLIRLCYILYNGSGIKNQRDYLNRSLTDDPWKSFQLGDKFLWDHVRSCAHNLTEFDESRPKFL